MTLKVSVRADDGEKHELDVNYLLFHKGKLYSAGDDGNIKVWSPDLTKLAEVKAHARSVYCLAASDDTLYSCSNDGTLKSWELDTLKAKKTLMDDKALELARVSYANGAVYCGDNEGNIKVFKNDTYYGVFNICEAVKDMEVVGHLLFTVKDADLVVTDMKLDGEHLQYGTLVTYMGRAPITIIGNTLLAWPTREGKDILLHENNLKSHFKEVSRIPNASDMLINALAGASWDGQEILFSGGWDKIIKKWKIENNGASVDGTCNVDLVINAMITGEKGEVYAAGSDGHIVRVNVE